MLHSAVHSPFVARVWITTSPTTNRVQDVVDKRHTEWECNCGGNSWTTTSKFTDYSLFVEHVKTCGWNTRVNIIINEQHEEITKGGYWQYNTGY